MGNGQEMCNMLVRGRGGDRPNTVNSSNFEESERRREPRYSILSSFGHEGRRVPSGMREAGIRNYGVSGIAEG